MAIGITVTGDALLGYVLTLTDATAEDVVHVYREDQTGHYASVPVRGVDMAAPTGATMVITDLEAPFNIDIRYVAESYSNADLETPVATATSDIVGTTLPYGFAIISDPLDSGQRIGLGVENLSEWGYESRVLGTHKVIGRRNPVIHMDVESGRSGSMTLTNLNVFAVDWDDTGPYVPYTVVDHANFETIFRAGRTLLFRNTWDESGFDDMYFKVMGHKTERLVHVGGNSGQVFKRYSLEFVEHDMPGTSITGLGLGTWQQVFDNNADWQEVNDQHGNWTSVLVNPRL